MIKKQATSAYLPTRTDFLSLYREIRYKKPYNTALYDKYQALRTLSSKRYDTVVRDALKKDKEYQKLKKAESAANKEYERKSKALCKMRDNLEFDVKLNGITRKNFNQLRTLLKLFKVMEGSVI